MWVHARKGLVVVSLVLALTRLAAAAPFLIVTGDGTGADTYVRLGAPTSNFGTASGITVKDAGGSSTTRKGYVAFDVSGIAAMVSDATLTLDVVTNNQGSSNPDPKVFTVEVLGLLDGHGGEGWAETVVTWDDAPANGTNNAVTGEALRLGTITVPAVPVPTTVTFSDTALRSFLNMDTDGRATIILRRVGGGNGPNLAFAAKEHDSANPPTLSGDTTAGQFLTLTTNDGAGADSYVRLGGGQTDTNFGNAHEVLAKNAGSGSTTRKGYLRFDLSSVNTEIVDASLLLGVSTNNGGSSSPNPQTQTVNVWGLDDGDPGEVWDEMDITWPDAPANNTANNGILGNASLLGQFVVRDVVDQVALFSSQELVDFLNDDDDSLATLILTRQTSNSSWNLGFASGENDAFMAPTLRLGVLTDDLIPEPGTLSLLAVGALGLLARRRKR